MCSACGSFDWAWRPTDGRGRVVGWTVTHRGFDPRRTTPFATMIVRLEQAPHVLIPGGWAGARDGSDLAVDVPVVATFVTETEPGGPPALLLWKAAERALPGSDGHDA
jgi:uncharacterized OB-fold protein